jgi:hypothetical protein
MTRTRTIAAAAIAAALAARTASANPTPAEFRCQLAMGKALTKWQDAASKCISKCEKGASEGKNPYTDCDPGSYDGATRVCLDAVSAKVVPAVTDACAGTCPACYTSADPDCAEEAGDRLADARNLFDTAVTFIACEDLVSSQHAEILCTKTFAKSINKLIDSMLKCYAKCYKGAEGGTIAGSTCAGFASDPATTTCINAAGAKAIANIDKKCFVPGRTAPSCYAGLSGASIVNLIQVATPPQADATFCGFE